MATKQIVYASIKLHKKPRTESEITLELPRGCVGILFVYDTIESLEEYEGDDEYITLTTERNSDTNDDKEEKDKKK
jgi:hypothetical protein